MAIFRLITVSLLLGQANVKLCGSVSQGLADLHRVCGAGFQLAQWRRQADDCRNGNWDACR